MRDQLPDPRGDKTEYPRQLTGPREMHCLAPGHRKERGPDSPALCCAVGKQAGMFKEWPQRSFRTGRKSWPCGLPSVSQNAGILAPGLWGPTLSHKTAPTPSWINQRKYHPGFWEPYFNIRGIQTPNSHPEVLDFPLHAQKLLPFWVPGP